MLIFSFSGIGAITNVFINLPISKQNIVDVVTAGTSTLILFSLK